MEGVTLKSDTHLMSYQEALYLIIETAELTGLDINYKHYVGTSINSFDLKVVQRRRSNHDLKLDDRDGWLDIYLQLNESDNVSFNNIINTRCKFKGFDLLNKDYSLMLIFLINFIKLNSNFYCENQEQGKVNRFLLEKCLEERTSKFVWCVPNEQNTDFILPENKWDFAPLEWKEYHNDLVLL